MLDYQEILNKLERDDLFKQWNQQNSDNYLTHFFAPLSASYERKSEWEVGYFSNGKITVFALQNDKFIVKPADDIFKKPDEKVEKLKSEDIKIDYQKALNVFKEEFPKRFPNEILGDGFVILQTFHEKTLWNFTFISKKLKFLNIKIDASNGEVADSEEVNLIDQK